VALALALAAGSSACRRDAPVKPPAGAGQGEGDASPPASTRPDRPVPPGWRLHASPAYHYSVLLPSAGELTVERVAADGELGESARVELAPVSYHVGVFVQDVGLAPTDNVIAFFDERVRWFTQSAGGEVVAQRDAPLRGYPGVGVDIRVPTGEGSFGALHLRIIRAGLYHFELLVISPDANEPRYEEFFDSFELAPELDRVVYGQYPAGQRDLVLAELHRERDEPALAHDFYTRAAESGAYEDRVLGAIHLSRGNALDRMGESAKAIAAFERAAALGVSPLFVQARRGALLLALQRYGEAFTIFDELLGGASGTKSKADEQKAVTDDGALLAEAYRLRGIARYGRAMSSSRGVVASSSSGEPSQAAPAPASSSEPAPPRLELKGDTPPARPVSVDAESKRLREGHAEALERVIADLDRAIHIEPMSTRGRAWRGVLRFERGDGEGAREDLMRATSAAPQQLGVLCRLLWRLGSRDAAKQARALVTWLEGHPPAALEQHGYRAHVFQVLLAELWMIEGSIDRASAAFQRARALRPGDPALIHRHGSALDRHGAHAEALRAFERAHELAPDSLNYRNSLVWLLATSTTDAVRDGARAVELARPLLQRDDPTASHVDTVAAAFAEAGRWQEAQDAQRRAMEILRRRGASAEQLADYERRLSAYAAHEPWRERFDDVEE
ncbi:MAG: hypothetical protein KC468_23390, partial [Myxococcales bacterium]|nr:hypothetical protein [Myxococcales bacterium]